MCPLRHDQRAIIGNSCEGRIGSVIVTPEEIWHLIQTADNFLKYGKDERAVARARERYQQALSEAEKAGIPALVEQAKKRLEDLGALEN